MKDTDENIFDFDVTGEELKFLKIEQDNETSYFLSTSTRKRLSDLHFLFLIRDDKENYERINEMIRNY